MAKMGGCNQHMGGMNTAKPVVTKMGSNPTSYSRNNLSKGGVNKYVGGKRPGDCKGKC